MEEFTIYDAYFNPTSKHAKRYEKLAKNEFIPIIHVWIKVKQKGYLIQKRAKKDDLIPYQWATLSGLVLKDEIPIDAASRETFEELGINKSTEHFTLLKKIKTEKGRYQTVCFVYELNLDSLPPLTLNKDEVSETKTVTLETIKTLIQRKEFWDYKKLLDDQDYFELLEKSQS
ncbi:MAG: NUDIX domain-containing protein [Candidatus Izemoplasmataceae bacterium]